MVGLVMNQSTPAATSAAAPSAASPFMVTSDAYECF
jgi:hypothetical protein